jgi:light-regulated signal transduction histidine kinase (bacteriophytochrome)
MNYFYVKKESVGWQVFWIDRTRLNQLVNNIRITEIKYPNDTSKQITIFCENSEKRYLVEMRNSKAGEYPNDIKIKIRK